MQTVDMFNILREHINSKYSQVEAIKRLAWLESAASCGIGFDLGIANPKSI